MSNSRNTTARPSIRAWNIRVILYGFQLKSFVNIDYWLTKILRALYITLHGILRLYKFYAKTQHTNDDEPTGI